MARPPGHCLQPPSARPFQSPGVLTDLSKGFMSPVLHVTVVPSGWHPYTASLPQVLELPGPAWSRRSRSEVPEGGEGMRAVPSPQRNSTAVCCSDCVTGPCGVVAGPESLCHRSPMHLPHVHAALPGFISSSIHVANVIECRACTRPCSEETAEAKTEDPGPCGACPPV